MSKCGSDEAYKVEQMDGYKYYRILSREILKVEKKNINNFLSIFHVYIFHILFSVTNKLKARWF